LVGDAGLAGQVLLAVARGLCEESFEQCRQILARTLGGVTGVGGGGGCLSACHTSEDRPWPSTSASRSQIDGRSCGVRPRIPAARAQLRHSFFTPCPEYASRTLTRSTSTRGRYTVSGRRTPGRVGGGRARAAAPPRSDGPSRVVGSSPGSVKKSTST